MVMLSEDEIKRRIAEYRRKQKSHETNGRYDSAAFYEIKAQELEEVLEGEEDGKQLL